MTRRRQWPRGKNGDLPDWYGSDAPFVERTIGELMREEAGRDANYEGSWWTPAEDQEPDKLQSALASASVRDIDPLRALYPKISAYIHLPPMPKRRRGERKNRFRTHTFGFSTEELAAATAQDIYAIWRRDYGMKNRRRSLGQSTAADVAAAYFKLIGWKVSLSAVERKLWHHGRGRK